MARHPDLLERAFRAGVSSEGEEPRRPPRCARESRTGRSGPLAGHERVATLNALTPEFIRLRIGPAPGSTGGCRRASLDQDARRPVPRAARRCRHDRRPGGPPPRQLGNGAVTGDQDIHAPGGLTQPVQRRLIGAHLIGAARVEERDQDVGEHVPGEQDATVREDDRGVADGVRRCSTRTPPGTGPPSAGGDQPDQLERDARRALRRHLLRPLSGFTGSLGAGGGGIAWHVAEPGMPEQVVPVRMGGEPGDHREAEPVQVISGAG